MAPSRSRASTATWTVRTWSGDGPVEAGERVAASGLRADTGNVQLAGEPGDVALEDLIVGTLETTVEPGDEALSGRFSGGGRVSVGTDYVTARLPSEGNTELSLETLVGKISEAPGGYGPSKNRKGSED